MKGLLKGKLAGGRGHERQPSNRGLVTEGPGVTQKISHVLRHKSALPTVAASSGDPANDGMADALRKYQEFTSTMEELCCGCAAYSSAMETAFAKGSEVAGACSRLALAGGAQQERASRALLLLNTAKELGEASRKVLSWGLQTVIDPVLSEMQSYPDIAQLNAERNKARTVFLLKRWLFFQGRAAIWFMLDVHHYKSKVEDMEGNPKAAQDRLQRNREKLEQSEEDFKQRTRAMWDQFEAAERLRARVLEQQMEGIVEKNRDFFAEMASRYAQVCAAPAAAGGAGPRPPPPPAAASARPPISSHGGSESSFSVKDVAQNSVASSRNSRELSQQMNNMTIQDGGPPPPASRTPPAVAAASTNPFAPDAAAAAVPDAAPPAPSPAPVPATAPAPVPVPQTQPSPAPEKPIEDEDSISNASSEPMDIADAPDNQPSGAPEAPASPTGPEGREATPSPLPAADTDAVGPNPEPGPGPDTTEQEDGPVIPPGKIRLKAVFEYVAQQDGDLSFDVGDAIFVEDQVYEENAWIEGSKPDGSSGVFPTNYTEPWPAIL